MTVTPLLVLWLPCLVFTTQITFSHISRAGEESEARDPRDMFINSKFGNIISHRLASCQSSSPQYFSKMTHDRYLQKTKPRKPKLELQNGQYWPGGRARSYGGRLAGNTEKTTLSPGNDAGGRIGSFQPLFFGRSQNQTSNLKSQIFDKPSQLAELNNESSSAQVKTGRRRKRKSRFYPVWCDKSHPFGAWLRFASIRVSCNKL